MSIICFNINEPYSVLVPWETKPEVKFLDYPGKAKIILSGEPTIGINGRAVVIKVWKVTILPFHIFCSGRIEMCNRVWPFSTYRVIK